jgi:hypothetical protein
VTQEILDNSVEESYVVQLENGMYVKWVSDCFEEVVLCRNIKGARRIKSPMFSKRTALDTAIFIADKLDGKILKEVTQTVKTRTTIEIR